VALRRLSPGAGVLAGISGYRAQPEVEKLYRQVERESKNDQSNERLYGLRVLLRYENSAVPTETARQMTTVLDQEFIRISQQLGCSAEERVIAIVQSRDALPQIHRCRGVVRGTV